MESHKTTDDALVQKAKQGELDALEELVQRHQSWVFNLALRMMWKRESAEDATQEILVKAVTKLSSFQELSSFRTWLHRITVNHLLNVRKSEMETQKMTFSDMGLSLDSVPDLDLPDTRSLPVETHVLVEEARLGCITAMLMCLDRRQRIAFILGEVLGESSEVGAEAMGESAANFRQLLARARRDLYQFMNDKCGLINQSNPCRCARKAAGFMLNGWLDPHQLQFSKDRIRQIRQSAPTQLEELENLDLRHAELYRNQPLLQGPDLAARLRKIIEETGWNHP